MTPGGLTPIVRDTILDAQLAADLIHDFSGNTSSSAVTDTQVEETLRGLAPNAVGSTRGYVPRNATPRLFTGSGMALHPRQLFIIAPHPGRKAEDLPAAAFALSVLVGLPTPERSEQRFWLWS